MKRREFITSIGGILAYPLATRAEQPTNPRIGYFSGRSADAEGEYRDAIVRGLQLNGFVDGQNLTIEYRFSNGQDSRLPALADELLQQNVALFIATDTPSALVAKRAARIPVVFSAGGDPVKLGLVDSFNRPGGNATGVGVFVSELGPKRLQLIREILPHPDLIAYVVNLNSVSGPPQVPVMEAAADAMRQKILILSVSTENEIDTAFATIVGRKAAAIVYSASVFFQVARNKLVALAAQHAIPAVYEWPEFVRSGGLISYSSSRSEAGTQIGDYAGKILHGAKPSDLPVVQSTKFDLAINLKTAKALGLAVPHSLLAIADEVIE